MLIENIAEASVGIGPLLNYRKSKYMRNEEDEIGHNFFLCL